MFAFYMSGAGPLVRIVKPMRACLTILFTLLLGLAVTSCGRASAESKPDRMPTWVWFSVGDQTHSADKLVELAIQRITKEEGRPPYASARADVFFRTDSKEVLADVVVGQIMKLTWTVTFGKNMQILEYKKGVGRG